MNRIHTCVELLQHIETRYSNPKALNFFLSDTWQSLSTHEFLQAVKELALGLIDLGLQKNEPVGILALPSCYWTIADFAIMIAGGITVPLFANISDDHFKFQVKQTAMKLIFVDGTEQWEMFKRYSHLFNLVIDLSTEPANNTIKTKITSICHLFKNGRSLNETAPKMYEDLQKNVCRHSVATIVYTSGSSGMPKGVELTQENISCQLHLNPFNWDTKLDRYLSVLPLEHIFGRNVNFWLLFWGVSVYYTSDYKNIKLICTLIKPTCLIVVPRLLEKIHAGMVSQVQQKKGIKHLIGKLAINLAHQNKIKLWQKPLIALYDFLVYSRLRQGLGGQLRVVISGGAHLAPYFHDFFACIGIRIYEGWGLTEACPVCINSPDNYKIGTVGRCLEGQRLQIAPNGEVLVKGPLVMKGYYLNKSLTQSVIDSQGWLHTGDKGSIDSAGRLTIISRIKELYKTSTGEYVAPIPIEQALCRHPLIESAMVIADGRKFTTALLFPNMQVLEGFKIKYGQANITDEQFLKSLFIINEINHLMLSINKKLNHAEQLRNYRFILKALTIKDEELTPSMKIKRETILKKYHELIDSMYGEENQ